MLEMYVLVPIGEHLTKMWAETLAFSELGCLDALVRLHGREKAGKLRAGLHLCKVYVNLLEIVPREQWEGR